jgi:hypothetical protein
VTVKEDKDYNYGELASVDKWDLMCLVDLEYLKRRVVSCLIIQDNEFFYQLCTTPFEIYSAGNLKSKEHWREPFTVDDRNSKRINSTTLLVSSNDDTYIDESKDVLHVFRLGSPMLNYLLDDKKFNISLVARMTMLHGKIDDNRKNKRGRIINFGVKGEYGLTQKETIAVDGLHYFKDIKPEEKKQFLFSIASIGQLIWECMYKMQIEADCPPLATDFNRDVLYAFVKMNKGHYDCKSKC